LAFWVHLGLSPFFAGAWPPKPAPPHAVEEKGGGKVVEERDTQDTQSLSPETIRPRPESIQ